jgi:acyl-CoA synthetase (AMP-forming)/AMP-acid ligase II
MQPRNTLKELLSSPDPERPAIGAPGRPALIFAALTDLIDATIRRLNDLGLGRNDRIAIVLPNGPEMATCFMSVASGATSAPLNPSYRAEEFEFYLNDINAKLLIVMRGVNSPALEVAAKLGIPVADLVPDETAGEFVLEPRGTIALSGTPAQKGYAEVDDVALVLHTSGTTSRPKIVPLSQQNVCASARHVCETLAFTAADRGLNIMPLFHIHGLIAGILAPLSAGSRVFCSPGFDALKFFSWMDECRPTWFTAVPTMHQAILARAPRNADVIKRNPLRFLRSSSSSMPPQVIHQLEAVFNAPLIEAYAMTEAAHQMATNPLPPGKRKPGTVGLPGGPDVEIMDEAGNLLPPNTVGEIVIRGPNVTLGYENNPKANAEAFVNGWFRTGDQGLKDSEGYISLTGRLKEIINRGGEKISPREVDEVIMDHPAVAQVVCFALPHPKLGEEVGAAVVLKEGAAATERDIREFVATRMADFKVPKKVLILTELPKGSTGKLQRIGLAQKLGLA